MDPVSALSLACNALQVAELGINTVKLCYKLYREGSINDDVIKSTRSFIEANDILKTSLRPQNESLALGKQDQILYDITAKTCDVASKLCVALDKYSIPATEAKRKRRVVSMAVKAMWNRNSIEDIQARLSEYRSVIRDHILVDQRERFKMLSKEQLEGFSSLHSNISLIGDVINDLVQQAEQTRALVVQEHARTRREISEELQAGRQKLAEEEHHKRVLDSLYFPVMHARQEEVRDAYKQTFEWIYSKSDSGTAPWSNFHQWLTSRNGFYHVNGKAGSGKSTLMRYIDNDKRTIRRSEQWAGASRHIKCSFFFWRAGSRLQKNILGFLRTLLHSILSSSQRLTMHVLPDISGPLPAWTERNLRQCLQRCLDQTFQRFYLTIILDGLDEFETGNGITHEELLDFLHEIVQQEHVRCLVSSRPLRVFEARFEPYAKLRLQDLTQSDIEDYVWGSLHAGGGSFNPSKPDSLSPLVKLTRTIVSRADGVFLWARLAVNSVKEGVLNEDSWEQLQQRVGLMPTEFKEMYAFMFESISPIYRTTALRYMALLSASLHPLTVVDVALIDMEQQEHINYEAGLQSNAAILHVCEVTRRRILTRCSGFLEIRTTPNLRHSDIDENEHQERARHDFECLEDYENFAYISFMHATAYDFYCELSKGTACAEAFKQCAHWSANRALATSSTAYFQLLVALKRIKFNGLLLSPLKAMDYIQADHDMPLHLCKTLVSDLDRTGGRWLKSVVREPIPLSVHWSICLNEYSDTCFLFRCGDACQRIRGVISLLDSADVSQASNRIVCDTLGLCASRGLILYVADALTTADASTADYILHSALAGIEGNLHFHVINANNEACESCFDVISAALARGASPQSVQSTASSEQATKQRQDNLDGFLPAMYEETAWQKFLRLLVLYVDRLELLVTERDDRRNGATALNVIFASNGEQAALSKWLQVLRSMLKAGAEQNAMIRSVGVNVWHEGSDAVEQRLHFDLSTLGYIQYIGTGKYPECLETATSMAEQGAEVLVTISETIDQRLLSSSTARALTNVRRYTQYPYVPLAQDVENLHQGLRLILTAREETSAEREATLERRADYLRREDRIQRRVAGRGIESPGFALDATQVAENAKQPT